MKRLLALILVLVSFLFAFSGCTDGGEEGKYESEAFFGVARFSARINGLIVYIPKYGEVQIPKNEGRCTCYDGHEENEDYSYRLRPGDLVKINFKYKKSWDDGGVQIMESFPARFDRDAELIEVLRKDICFNKEDTGYVMSFPKDTETESASAGDTLNFYFYRTATDGLGAYRERKELYAEGEVVSNAGDKITVNLTIHGEEDKFLEYYCSMSLELVKAE